VVVEGHTRAGVTYPRVDYGAWELSTECANAARRALTFYAVSPTQIERVGGYADTQPIRGLAPGAESNQRVTLNLSTGKTKPADRPASAIADPSSPSSGHAPAKPAVTNISKPQLFPTENSVSPP
jgi:chemotaxis protein MotB